MKKLTNVHEIVVILWKCSFLMRVLLALFISQEGVDLLKAQRNIHVVFR